MLTYKVDFQFIISNSSLHHTLNKYFDVFFERASFKGYKLDQDIWERTDAFQKFVSELEDYKEIYLKAFRYKCPMCLSNINNDDSILTFAHPIGKNKEYPELVKEYKNIMPLCTKCSGEYKVNYKIKRSNGVESIYDLCRKVPSLVIPHLESSLTHLYLDDNSIRFETNRYLSTAKIFLPEILDDIEIHNRSIVGHYDYEESIYKLLHGKYFERGEFYDDFKYAKYIERKNIEYRKILTRNYTNKRVYNSIFPLEFQYKNLRELRTGSIVLSDKSYLCFLGENGVGKTTLLQSLYFTLSSDKNSNFKEENYAYRNDRDVVLSFNYIFNEKCSSKNISKSGENITRWEQHDGVKARFRKDLGVLYLDDKRNSYGRHELELSWLFEQSKKTFAEVAVIIKAFLNIEEATLYRNNGSIYSDFEGRRQDLSKLSSGYKAVISLIIAIYKQLVAKNEGYSIGNSGFKLIVLIDEIELHLHPRWKMTIVDKLIKNFPDVFFFITTHDPLVLRQCNDEVCYKIEKNISGKSELSEVIDFSSYDVDMLLSSPIFGVEYEHEHDDRQINESLRQYLARKIVNDSIHNYKKLSSDVLSMMLEMAVRDEKDRS